MFLPILLTNFLMNFFDELFWWILLTNLINEFFDEFFWRIFLTNFLTYNLSTIASFRIGVPSILLLKMLPEALSMTLPSLVFSALPNKWNLQIYCFSLFIGRNVFQSTLQVRFMVRKFNSSFLVLKLMVTKKDNFSICGRGFKFSTPKNIRRFDQ